MSIAYNYKVLSVDNSAKCMEVEYTSEGFGKHIVSTRLPYDNEKLSDLIHSYSPIPIWESESKTFATVDVGASGSYSPSENNQNQIDETENSKMWMQTEFEKSVAKALVKFGVLDSDPTGIGVTQL